MFDWITKPKYELTTLDNIISTVEIIFLICILSFLFVLYIEFRNWLRTRKSDREDKNK